MLGITGATIVTLAHIGETDALIEDADGDAVLLAQSTQGEWFMVDCGRALDLRIDLRRDLATAGAAWQATYYGTAY